MVLFWKIRGCSDIIHCIVLYCTILCYPELFYVILYQRSFFRPDPCVGLFFFEFGGFGLSFRGRKCRIPKDVDIFARCFKALHMYTDTYTGAYSMYLIYIYICVCVCVCLHVYAYSCMHMCVYVYMFVCMHMYVYVCVCVCVCMFIRKRECMYIRMYIYI